MEECSLRLGSQGDALRTLALSNDSIAILIALFILTFKESRASVLLRWKTSAFNTLHAQLKRAVPSTPRIRWKSRDDEQLGALTQMIRVLLTLPFRLLLTEPAVFFFSLWAAFAWSILYISLAAVPLIYTTTHNFSLASSNAFFAATYAGALACTPLAIHQDRLTRRLSRSPSQPETRLYFARAASALLPAGLFLFGWTARASAHWIWPAAATGLATAGIFAVYLAVFNYLSGRFASSALAAQGFCRNGAGRGAGAGGGPDVRGARVRRRGERARGGGGGVDRGAVGVGALWGADQGDD